MSEDNKMEQTTTVRLTDTQRVQNPFVGMNDKDVMEDAASLAMSQGLACIQNEFKTGALIAKSTLDSSDGFERLSNIDNDLKQSLRREQTSPYRSLPLMQYLLAALCAGCAIVQGMDQTIINGAQEYYFNDFKVTDKALQGFVNGAPYVLASVSGPGLNLFLNKSCGRRGTLAFGCFFAFLTAIFQAVSPTLPVFIFSRMLLGLAVGVMSSTTPVYAAETAPAAVRGAMTMMWQMWTAAGIMIGLGVSAGLREVKPGGEGPLASGDNQWRIMMGLTAVPPLIVGTLVYSLPESPRYYLEKGEVAKAFQAMRRLRKNNVFAARDLYLSYKKLEVENEINQGADIWTRLRKSLKTRRTLRAFQSSWFVMIMQQLCGVNAIAYYSTSMFMAAGYTRKKAMEVSLGFGAINFTFALVALWLIDRAGRRPLLIFTFPIMSLCLFWTGGSYMIPNSDIRTISTMISIFIFTAFYSVGPGPVTFVYAAEAFPLDIRALAMASSTSVTWMLNFVVSFTWPKLTEAWGVEPAFFWYASWNVVGFLFTLFLLPETKGRTLEDMDMVFAVRNRDHIKYQCRIMASFWRKDKKTVEDPTARRVEPTALLSDGSTEAVMLSSGAQV